MVKATQIAKEINNKLSVSSNSKSIIKAPKNEKANMSKISVGESFSNTQYMRVIGLYPKYLELITSKGSIQRIERGII